MILLESRVAGILLISSLCSILLFLLAVMSERNERYGVTDLLQGGETGYQQVYLNAGQCYEVRGDFLVPWSVSAPRKIYDISVELVIRDGHTLLFDENLSLSQYGYSRTKSVLTKYGTFFSFYIEDDHSLLFFADTGNIDSSVTVSRLDLVRSNGGGKSKYIFVVVLILFMLTFLIEILSTRSLARKMISIIFMFLIAGIFCVAWKNGYFLQCGNSQNILGEVNSHGKQGQ